MSADDKQITEQLGPQWRHVDVECLDTVDSTNAWLACAPLKRPTLVTANYQTHGRGRQARPWQSPPGGVYVSVGWRLPPGAVVPSALPLAVGIYLVHALEDLGCPGIGLKWPNDLIADGAKLGGILTEQIAHPAGGMALIIGVGLNVDRIAITELPADRQAIGVSDIARLPTRAALVAAIGTAALEAGSLEVTDTERLIQVEWPRLDVLAGRTITVDHEQGRQLHGIANGVTAAGALRLSTPAGETPLWSGECRIQGGWSGAL